MNKLAIRLRGIALAVAGVMFAVAASAQAPYGYVTVSGSSIVDSSGNPETNGTIYFAPVNNAGVPIGYRTGIGYGANLTITEGSGSLTGCTVFSGGSGYTSTPKVLLSGGGGTGGTATVTVSGGAVTGCAASGGSGYTSAPTSKIVGYGQTIFTPVQATITNGAWSMQIADTALTFPVNVCFAVTAVDNVSGNQLLGPGMGCVQPAGSGTAVTGSQAWCTAGTPPNGGACDFDAYPPNLAALVVTVTGPTGATGATGAAGAAGATGATGPPGGSLSYPGVTSDGSNGLVIAAQVAAATYNFMYKGPTGSPQPYLNQYGFTLNPIAWGAAGDGATDDTSILQSMLNTGLSLTLPWDGTSGHCFLISSPLVLKSGQQIYGSGKSIFAGPGGLCTKTPNINLISIGTPSVSVQGVGIHDLNMAYTGAGLPTRLSLGTSTAASHPARRCRRAARTITPRRALASLAATMSAQPSRSPLGSSPL